MAVATKPRPTAVKPTTKTAPKAAPKVEYGGTLVLPSGTRPSKATDARGYRDLLRCAHLIERGDDLWLVATDAYVAIGLKIPKRNGLQPGSIPSAVLTAIEGKTAKVLDSITVTQENDHTWVVGYADHSVRAWGAPTPEKFPDLESIGLFGSGAKRGAADTIGVNPSYMARVGEAIGAGDGVVCYPGENPTKALRMVPTAKHLRDERMGLVMPLRWDS